MTDTHKLISNGCNHDLFPPARLMFWSDIGGDQHAIWRAKMDGTDPRVFVKGPNVNQPASKFTYY